MKVGFTCSTFDLLHAGHVQMLRDAKDQCEYLICALQIDPSLDRAEKNPPVQTVVERFIQLSAISYVDEVIPYATEKDLEDIPENVKSGLELIFVDNVDDVLKIALTKPLIPIEWNEDESTSSGSEISEDDQDQDQDPLLTH